MIAMTTLDAVAQAQKVVTDDPDYARALASALERELAIEPIRRTMRTWEMSATKTARMFGVSRAALEKWLRNGPPADRAPQIAVLDQATQLLIDHVRVDRIPAVVRRPAPRLDGRSLLDVAMDGDLIVIRDELRTTFDIHRVQP